MRAHYRDTILDRAGNALAGASVTVRQVGTVNAITETMYDDDTGAGVLGNPLTADASGVIDFYLLAPKRVDLYVVAAGYTTITVEDVDVAAPLPVSYPITDPGNAGNIPVVYSGQIALVTGGAGETRALAIPTFIGQTLDLYFKTDGGGDCVITAASDVTNTAGENVLTFSDAGEHILLRAIEKGAALAWRVVCNDGVVLS